MAPSSRGDKCPQAQLVIDRAHRIILDKTGIQGVFDMQLTYAAWNSPMLLRRRLHFTARNAADRPSRPGRENTGISSMTLPLYKLTDSIPVLKYDAYGTRPKSLGDCAEDKLANKRSDSKLRTHVNLCFTLTSAQ